MKPLDVVAAIIESAGTILLAERPHGKHLAGLWEFPGGKVEAGESFEAALGRELQEELQLRIEIKRELGSFTHTYDRGTVVIRAYVVRPLGEPRSTRDVHQFRWSSPQAIEEAQLVPADIPILRAYLQAIS